MSGRITWESAKGNQIEVTQYHRYDVLDYWIEQAKIKDARIAELEQDKAELENLVARIVSTYEFNLAVQVESIYRWCKSYQRAKVVK